MSKPAPQCVTEAERNTPPLAVEFHDRHGRIYGFPYGHLLNYLCERNPDSDTSPNAPTDRFSCWFSTHDVVLLGWRLAKLAPLLRHGKLMIVSAAEARYYGLSGDEPFVCDMVVTSAQREPSEP
jgi:hypothetical protein